MSINQLIFRNLKKNLKNYYLYVFALVFSAGLYFAFVTLQYTPSMADAQGGVRGTAAVRAASVLLVAIVAVFLWYANTLFIKRRSQEIGLFQLVGMTKGRIFRILSAENLIIYFGSLVIGIVVGFSISKLILLIFFKVTGLDDAVATLYFSSEALLQTLLVFGGIYLLIMVTNYLFIKRQTILALFQTTSKSEEKVKNLSIWEKVMGILGIILIGSGYYVSSILFSGNLGTMNSLFFAMIFILASVIIGTYFMYKGSVSTISNVIRKKKDGYLNINDVLSLSSIMFRMKSNAFLLTIITTVSALAIGLLSLSYIAYYSAEKQAESYSPDDFSFTNEEDAETFTQALENAGINFRTVQIPVIQVNVNMEDIMTADMEGMNFTPSDTTLSVISETAVDRVDIDEGGTMLSGYSNAIQNFITFKEEGDLIVNSGEQPVTLEYLGLHENAVVSNYFTGGGFPAAVVDDALFNTIQEEKDPALNNEISNLYTGIELDSQSQIQAANDIYLEQGSGEGESNSQYQSAMNQKQNMGTIMFIVGFLGLAFLITSGCILYFKQMDESEEEQPNYTILRKLGFTERDLLRGIQGKQMYNFGIPLLIGLAHSYFAVKSGWFLFGTEIWTPMLIVMGLYTLLYSIFCLLSVLYSKKIIKEAL
ncbi:ABC transporter permease [Salibacterium lacus]|uniref:ABC transporter permease n=1 Tax=Salibacterium lacus TaxID=1898109 RepID=A0ABW5T3L1_9BACI